jgi:hypothetical protein
MLPGLAKSQELIDGKYYDNDLQFYVVEENVKRTGVIEICITNSDKRCIENLLTGYEILVYDNSNKEIWASIWSGQSMRVKFDNKLPNAHYVIIRARAPYVVNKRTTTRIYQDEPIELKHFVR